MVTSATALSTIPTGEDDPPDMNDFRSAYFVDTSGHVFINYGGNYIGDSYGFIRINLSIITEK